MRLRAASWTPGDSTIFEDKPQVLIFKVEQTQDHQVHPWMGLSVVNRIPGDERGKYERS
jgi:hypothetical protein